MRIKYQTIKLGDVLEICDSGTWGNESPDGMPLLRSTNMQNGQLILDDLKYINVPKNLHDQYMLREGDILMTKSSGSVDHIGKSLFITRDMDSKYGFSNFTQRLRVDRKIILPEWVYLKVSDTATRDFLLGASQTTTGLRNLKIPVLKNLEIPLPPIAEQKRIVKKIEELFAKIDAALLARREAKEDAAMIMRVALDEAFGEAGGKGWKIQEIKDICEHPQYGYTVSSSRENIGPKLLRITDIQNGTVDWSQVPFCKCEDIDKYRLIDNDIVFARTGATVGKSYIVNNVPENIIYASYLIRLRVTDKVLPKYLYHFFQSPDYWKQITDGQVGMAQPNVNGSSWQN